MKISSFFKPLSFLPALALMYMIYSFSAQQGETSSSLSFKVSKKIIQAVDVVTQQNWDDWEIEQHANQIHGIVRKGAHITEYFLLAIAVSFPLYVYGVRGILLMILAGAICVGYACTDEYHQSLVSGRAASSRDVMIDSIGIFFGVILTRLIGWSGRMAITGPAYERRQKKQQKALDAREEELRRREEALRREERRYQQSVPSRRPSQRRYREDPRASQNANVRYREDPRASQNADVRYREDPRASQNANVRYREDPRASQNASSTSGGADIRRQVPSGPDRSVRSVHSTVDDRTKVLGTEHEVDDRTRVYRTEEEQRRMEEAYRRQVYERRRVQSEELQDDSTSDQLSEDLPFSSLFRKKK